MKFKLIITLTTATTLGCLTHLANSVISPVAHVAKKIQPVATTSKAVLVKGKLPDRFIWHRFTRDGLKHFEKFEPHAYTCPGGVRTIGYGFTDKALVSKNSLSKVEAQAILDAKLEAHCDIVRKNVKVKLTIPQVYALASFTYNCGVGNLRQLINGKGRLNSGNYDSVAELMPKYRIGGGKVLNGLVRRRAWEVKLWQQG
jgi:GH24 family phage-related lysozyme (muramidase)